MAHPPEVRRVVAASAADPHLVELHRAENAAAGRYPFIRPPEGARASHHRGVLRCVRRRRIRFRDPAADLPPGRTSLGMVSEDWEMPSRDSIQAPEPTELGSDPWPEGSDDQEMGSDGKEMGFRAW